MQDENMSHMENRSTSPLSRLAGLPTVWAEKYTETVCNSLSPKTGSCSNDITSADPSPGASPDKCQIIAEISGTTLIALELNTLCLLMNPVPSLLLGNLLR